MVVCPAAIVLQRNKKERVMKVYLVAVLLAMALFGAIGITVVGVLAHAPVLTLIAVIATTMTAVIPVFLI